MSNTTSTTNYVPTSIIKVAKNATIPAKAGTLRYKRLAVMQQCTGQTVAAFYAKCRKTVPGTVSKKLLAVAINRGFAKLPAKPPVKLYIIIIIYHPHPHKREKIVSVCLL